VWSLPLKVQLPLGAGRVARVDHVSRLRTEYTRVGLTEADAAPAPVAQFRVPGPRLHHPVYRESEQRHTARTEAEPRERCAPGTSSRRNVSRIMQLR
jgi:hypothetical protein